MYFRVPHFNRRGFLKSSILVSTSRRSNFAPSATQFHRPRQEWAVCKSKYPASTIREHDPIAVVKSVGINVLE